LTSFRLPRKFPIDILQNSLPTALAIQRDLIGENGGIVYILARINITTNGIQLGNLDFGEKKPH